MLARTGNVRVAAPARAIAVRPVVAARAQVVVKALEAPAPVVAAQSAATDGEQARAVLRYIRGSPNKVRRVLDTIRGRTYEDALGMLEFMPYRSCEPILATLMSAAANAKHNMGMRKSKLIVSECYCDEGPTLKRFRPRAQGRAYKIRKRTSHIVIKVSEQQ